MMETTHAAEEWRRLCVGGRHSVIVLRVRTAGEQKQKSRYEFCHFVYFSRGIRLGVPPAPFAGDGLAGGGAEAIGDFRSLDKGQRPHFSTAVNKVDSNCGCGISARNTHNGAL